MNKIYLDDIEAELMTLDKKYMKEQIDFNIYAEEKGKRLDLIYRIFDEDLDCYLSENFLKTIFKISVNPPLEKAIIELMIKKSLLVLFQINRVNFLQFLEENNRKDIIDIIIPSLTSDEKNSFEEHMRLLLMK